MDTKEAPGILLAKTPKEPGSPRESETLLGHSRHVFDVAQSLISTVGMSALQSTGLESHFLEDLRQTVLRSAYLHDLGKASSQFQRVVVSREQPWQALRHEFISTWLPLRFSDFDRWIFAGCTELARLASLIAVLGHHLKLADGTQICAHEGSGDPQVLVLCNHSGFQSVLRSASHSLGLSPHLPELPQTAIDLLDRPLGELRDWLIQANEWYQRQNPDTRRFVSLTKALLVAADVAGSAVPKFDVDPGKWTKEVLQRVCRTEQLEEIAYGRLDGQRPRQFQKQVAESMSRAAFIRAGCGSGKTIGAYLWAARRAEGRKLFFCYPTTGTTTEGFRDYVIPSEMSSEALLLHSRSECDLEDLLGTPDDTVLDQSLRIESLASWDVPLVLCTADSVLGLVQNNRRALFSFPSFANGAFVFDEIHQYDDRLFGALLRFVDAFRGAPILLMSASLPRARLEAIQQQMDRRDRPLDIIQGPADLEQIPRYRMEPLQHHPPWDLIENAMRRGEKILWVANTVNRCVEFAQQAGERGLQPLPYHSRYRYCDRVRMHKAVMESFKSEGAALAVTTQVCEVSLDISADVLITDVAPIPALIQRMGRLNRRVTPQNPGNPRPTICLQPRSALPYEQAELDVARTWLHNLGTKPLSQKALASAFEDLSPGGAVFPVQSAWLDSGPFGVQAPLREAAATVMVIRPEDGSLCADHRKRPILKQVVRYAIPMTLGPVANEIGTWRRLSFALLSPPGRICYSQEWGARWVGK